ncbi:MAG TPA: hypothetical protein VM537_32015 [Anaerolineae bacterium]|nr:hypothetical protein [Anaerolineae bacterium]
MNYTKGPFEITGPSNGRIRTIDDGGDYAIVQAGCIVGEAYYHVGVGRNEDAAANALLWANAGELVEALKFYARSSQYIVTYKYRGGELISADASIGDDAGAKAREVLAAVGIKGG